MLHTLFSKLLVVLLGFGVAMTAIFAAVMQFSHEKYHLELDQRAASALASRIVAQGLGGVGGINAPEALQGDLARLSAVNPGVDLYVLDAQGKVLAASPSSGHLQRSQVDMAPVRQYLAGRTELPILGVDPSDPSRDDVFSVASVSADENTGPYLYALLHRREHQSGAGLIKASYVVGQGLWIVVSATLFAVLSSVVIVRLLTRRLARLTADMEKYSQTDFIDAPDLRTHPRAEAQDEVGRLGRTFAEMAQRIVNQMQELKRADATRCELLASIANDLRRPLSSVRGHLETLVREEPTLSAEEKHEHLDVAMRKTTRMVNLVSKLSESARLEARQVPPELDVFVLPDVVQDVLQKFSRDAGQKGIDLCADIPDHLPLAVGDVGLIERVLEHLVENALRYTDSGGTVTVRLARGKRNLAVEVRDTGIGIPPEHLPKIFDRCFRAEAHRPSTSENAGFGLSIVKNMLELHGSEIRVESTVGVGTTFRFDIPTGSETHAAANLTLPLPGRAMAGEDLRIAVQSPSKLGGARRGGGPTWRVGRR